MKMYLGTVLVICHLFATTVLAEESLWKELNIEIFKLSQQGKYLDAAKVAQRALKVAAETFGPDHPDLRQSLNNPAIPYKNQGKYGEAESFYKRALKIWERALGPDDPERANSIIVSYHTSNLKN